MGNRARCVKDILLETDGTPNKGWQTAPNIPSVFIESTNKVLKHYHENVGTDGVIVIGKDYDFDRVKHSQEYETRIWTFDVYVLSETAAKLEAMVMQFREVFDRYTNAPFATNTNSYTYSYAGVEDAATHSADYNDFYFQGSVILKQEFLAVVIA